MSRIYIQRGMGHFFVTLLSLPEDPSVLLICAGKCQRERKMHTPRVSISFHKPSGNGKRPALHSVSNFILNFRKRRDFTEDTRNHIFIMEIMGMLTLWVVWLSLVWGCFLGKGREGAQHCHAGRGLFCSAGSALQWGSVTSSPVGSLGC